MPGPLLDRTEAPVLCSLGRLLASYRALVTYFRLWHLPSYKPRSSWQYFFICNQMAQPWKLLPTDNKPKPLACNSEAQPPDWSEGAPTS